MHRKLILKAIFQNNIDQVLGSVSADWSYTYDKKSIIITNAYEQFKLSFFVWQQFTVQVKPGFAHIYTKLHRFAQNVNDDYKKLLQAHKQEQNAIYQHMVDKWFITCNFLSKHNLNLPVNDKQAVTYLKSMHKKKPMIINDLIDGFEKAKVLLNENNV